MGHETRRGRKRERIRDGAGEGLEAERLVRMQMCRYQIETGMPGKFALGARGGAAVARDPADVRDHRGGGRGLEGRDHGVEAVAQDAMW